MPVSVANSTQAEADRSGQSPPTSIFGDLTPLDWTLLALLCAAMFAIAIYRSRTRLLWADELISHQIFSDPSFFHMLRAWYRGADSGGLTYYLLCPVWLRLFGLSELSLRLFSTAGMSVALMLLWTALRRYVSTLLTAAAAGVIFFTSPAMLWQELNGRFYGLFFAFAALASLLFLLVLERAKPSRRLLAMLFFAHAGLVASHIFGLIFSFSLLVGTWVADRLHRRFRWAVYLLPVASWLFALISLPSLIASASVVKTVFWTQKPNLQDFLYSFVGFGRVTAAIVGVLLCLAALRLLTIRWFPLPAATLTRPMFAPVALVGSLVLAALVFFAKSQVGISIFADRYLLPLSIATLFVLAGALRLLLPPAVSSPRSMVTVAIASVAVLLPCCLFGATRQTNFLLYPAASYVEHLNPSLEPGVPAVAALPEFVFLQTYDRAHHFLYLTDWAYDNDPRHLADYSGERLMENWKHAGYLSADILPCTEIFSRYPRVDLLVGFHLTPWFNDRVLHDPHLRVVHRGFVHEWDYVDVWSVERLSPGPPPC